MDCEFPIVFSDLSRPWGGFHCIDPSATSAFIEKYFSGMDIAQSGTLSPKILLVQPGQRLSWQWHRRRREIWAVVEGPVGVMTSPNDNETEVRVLQTGDTITLDVRERHRLIGLSSLGVVAELWQHTDPDHPSNEEDIVRVMDDYARV